MKLIYAIAFTFFSDILALFALINNNETIFLSLVFFGFNFSAIGCTKLFNGRELIIHKLLMIAGIIITIWLCKIALFVLLLGNFTSWL